MNDPTPFDICEQQTIEDKLRDAITRWHAQIDKRKEDRRLCPWHREEYDGEIDALIQVIAEVQPMLTRPAGTIT